MSMETGHLASLAPNTPRLLPPAISFDPVTGRFCGTIAPGSVVKVASSEDQQTFTAAAGPDGKWAVALGKPPRWYTIFQIWSENAATGASSEKIQYTFGGSSPKLRDVYVSEGMAFGSADEFAQITVYGPGGDILGCAGAFGKEHGWRVKFSEKLKAGEKVCIVAKLLNGNSAMPLFAEVNAFSVDHRGPSHFSGAGAEPGETVQLFDRDAGSLLGAAKASADGAWSISLAKPLESGERLAVRRILKDGTTVEGPIFAGFFGSTLAPDITAGTSTQAWGTATPYYWVTVDVYSGNSQIAADNSPVQVQANGTWSKSLPTYAYPGMLLVARTASSPGGQESRFYSALAYEGDRQNPAFVSGVNTYNATGYANPNAYIVVSTPQNGELTAFTVDSFGNWSFPGSWSSFGVSDPANTQFVFTMCENPSGIGTTAVSSVRSVPPEIVGTSDPNKTVPETPVFEQYTGSYFSGTEATMPSYVEVFDKTQNRNAITEEPMNVSGNNWSTTGSTLVDLNNGLQPPIPLGDQVWARATYIRTDNDPGNTSDPSDYVTVGTQPGTTKRPWPPEIDNVDTAIISGTSQENVYVELTVNAQGTITKFGPMFNTQTAWKIDIGSPQYNGTTISAVAYYSGGSPSDPFIKQVGRSAGGMLTLSSVTQTNLTGSAADPGQNILAWRTSDGAKIVDFQLTDPKSTAFNAPYIGGLTLDVNDQINVVSAFPGGGSMTEYNSKPEGYPIVQ